MRFSFLIPVESNNDSNTKKQTDKMNNTDTNSGYHAEEGCSNKMEEYQSETSGNQRKELGESKTYSPIQSMLMRESPSWLAESTLLRKPVLQKGDVLHRYITGENEYNLLSEHYTDQPLIETTLETETISLVDVSGLGSINTANEANISNSQVKKKPTGAFRGFFDKCVGKVFGKGSVKADKSQKNFDIGNRLEDSELSDTSVNHIFSLDLDSNAYTDFSSQTFESRVDIPTDFDSFVSDDQWLFNVVSAQKFKYLCTNCSKHCWEESGKVPNLL
ncbi:hypothetical protein PMKS-001071 [Pichia membranifaciens]|uniref:Uncharacterized protein n=1 Tax=Pichia membranifaciens TaxID=4926 RepID=A0A1Q2YDY5_9ASCO|nr:hypothetical protein PMKS-001071 [Pichia membranifaciens]